MYSVPICNLTHLELLVGTLQFVCAVLLLVYHLCAIPVTHEGL
jgi:hypothetical protein